MRRELFQLALDAACSEVLMDTAQNTAHDRERLGFTEQAWHYYQYAVDLAERYDRLFDKYIYKAVESGLDKQAAEEAYYEALVASRSIDNESVMVLLDKERFYDVIMPHFLFIANRIERSLSI